MPSFRNGAVEIAYLDEGEGDPIVLVHGFASSKSVNWVFPRWVSDLKKNGRRVIALDLRGHGESSKLYDSSEYSIEIMADDTLALMDHLKIGRADVMGYSLGARITASLGRIRPERLRSAIFGGLGIGLIAGGGPGENVAEALEAASLDDVTDPVGRTFRAFADQTGSDRRGDQHHECRDPHHACAVAVVRRSGMAIAIARTKAGLVCHPRKICV